MPKIFGEKPDLLGLKSNDALFKNKKYIYRITWWCQLYDKKK